jgi:hypothetical protein
MPLIKELRNRLNLDRVSDDFGTWHIHSEVTKDIA